MSLERVIAEQQKEIDRLKAAQDASLKAWDRNNKQVERVAMWAFGVLSYPGSPECHKELKDALMAMGYCPTCECNPCECEGQYD